MKKKPKSVPSRRVSNEMLARRAGMRERLLAQIRADKAKPKRPCSLMAFPGPRCLSGSRDPFYFSSCVKEYTKRSTPFLFFGGKAMKIRSLILLFLLGFLAVVLAESVSGCSGPASQARAPTLYDRVVFIGASASSGTGLGPGVSLAGEFENSLAVHYDAVSDHSKSEFFRKTTRERKEIVDEALTRDPTLVVAVDFLFWFANGMPATEAVRLSAVDEGLRLLDRFGCPVVVGTIPDVRHAATQTPFLKLIVPDEQTLRRANEELVRWATARPHVVLMPLAEAVRCQARGDSLVIAGVSYPTKDTLQKDMLHPNQEGLRLLNRLLVQSLIESGLSRASDFRFR